MALGKEAYITTAGAFVVDPFPGTTIKAMKERLAAEFVQTRKKIEGEWMGTFGNKDNMVRYVHITSDGRFVATVPISWRPNGMGGMSREEREVFRGQLAPGDLSSPASVTLVGAWTNTTEMLRATLNFNESSGALTGDLAASNRVTIGRIELSRMGD
jgi:hypothetical protein